MLKIFKHDLAMKSRHYLSNMFVFFYYLLIFFDEDEDRGSVTRRYKVKESSIDVKDRNVGARH